MKIFPKNNYSLKLNNDAISVISELQKQTLSKEQFVTNWNNQIFIGQIKGNEFEINLSKKIVGELCFLKGRLENKTGVLEIRTGKIFKISCLVVVTFILSGIFLAIIQNKYGVIFYLIMNILVIRLFLEFGFRIVSKKALNKLSEIDGIKNIKTSHNSR